MQIASISGCFQLYVMLNLVPGHQPQHWWLVIAMLLGSVATHLTSSEICNDCFPIESRNGKNRKLSLLLLTQLVTRHMSVKNKSQANFCKDMVKRLVYCF